MATAPICIAVQFRRANLVPTASASASCPLILICNKTTNSASSPGREGEGEWFKGRALVLMLVLMLMLDFTIRSITHHVSPNPTDSSLLSSAHSKRAYKSSSCSHPCVVTIPGPSEYHSHSPANGWQRNVSACDSS